MANTEYSGEQYSGTVVASDVRYGATFLNAENIAKAVPGEIIKDPITGELFTRRAIDGKVISFAQKSRTVYDFLQEFNLQLQSSISYKYPDFPGSYLVGTLFDTNTMLTRKQGELVNIYETPLEFPETDVNPGNVFAFAVAPETNGAFIKASVRYGDKNGIAYLTGKFALDESINFAGTTKPFGEWLEMHLKYQSAALYDTWRKLSGWKSSNMLVEASIIVSGQDASYRPVTVTTNGTYALRIGEAGYMAFPKGYAEGVANIASIIVRIDKIHMPKIQYEYFLMTTNIAKSSGMASPLSELIEADFIAAMRMVECYYFISSPTQLPAGDNRIIQQVVDYSFVKLGVDKLLTASGTRSAQSSAVEPTVWGLDSVWLEEVREVKGANITVPTGSKNDFKTLEQGLYNPASDMGVSFTTNGFDGSGMFISTRRV